MGRRNQQRNGLMELCRAENRRDVSHMPKFVAMIEARIEHIGRLRYPTFAELTPPAV